MQASLHPQPTAVYAPSGQSVIICQAGRPPAEFVAATSKQAAAAAAIASALTRTPGECTLKNPGGRFSFLGVDIFDGGSLIARARNSVAALRAVAALNDMGGANG